jgi:hypothetical protein
MCCDGSPDHGGSTHVLYFRTGGPQGGLCKTFPLKIRIPVTARFEDVTLQHYSDGEYGSTAVILRKLEADLPQRVALFKI